MPKELKSRFFNNKKTGSLGLRVRSTADRSVCSSSELSLPDNCVARTTSSARLMILVPPVSSSCSLVSSVVLISDLSSIHIRFIKSEVGGLSLDGKRARERNAAAMTMACKRFWRFSKRGAEKKSGGGSSCCEND